MTNEPQATFPLSSALSRNHISPHKAPSNVTSAGICTEPILVFFRSAHVFTSAALLSFVALPSLELGPSYNWSQRLLTDLHPLSHLQPQQKLTASTLDKLYSIPFRFQRFTPAGYHNSTFISKFCSSFVTFMSLLHQLEQRDAGTSQPRLSRDLWLLELGMSLLVMHSC